MDPATTLRKLGKLNYRAARLPLSLLDACVVRRWDEDAVARVGFDRYLGTLDLLAGRLLADDAIRQRGKILWRSAGSDVWAQAAADEPAADEPAADEPAADEPAADEPAADEPAADGPAADGPAAEPAGGGPAAWASANGPAAGTVGGGPATGLLAGDPAAGPAAGAPSGAAEGVPAGPAAGAPPGAAAGVPAGPAAGAPAGPGASVPAGPGACFPAGPGAGAPPGAAAGAPPGAAEGVPAGPAAGAPAGSTALSPVAFIFTLSAAVQAESVALCGDFNDWSADATPLELCSDGYWRVAVALQPGRSYRYRYLINGERWENARDADEYVPNPYGGTDSVVVVE